MRRGWCQTYPSRKWYSSPPTRSNSIPKNASSTLACGLVHREKQPDTQKRTEQTHLRQPQLIRVLHAYNIGISVGTLGARGMGRNVVRITHSASLPKHKGNGGCQSGRDQVGIVLTLLTKLRTKRAKSIGQDRIIPCVCPTYLGYQSEFGRRVRPLGAVVCIAPFV